MRPFLIGYLILCLNFFYFEAFAGSRVFNPSSTTSLETPQVKKRVVFIINPISGGKDKTSIVKNIKRRLDKKKFDIDIQYTKRPKHASEIAKKAVADNVDIVVAVGGDGSVNEISQALIGTSVTLAIIPTGSGNGLARHLEIPSHVSDAIDVIENGYTKTIDTVHINDRYYLGVAGIGFDAEVGWSFAEFGHRGFLSYLIVTLQKRFTYQSSSYDLFIDGKKLSRHALLVCFANSSQFGNGAYIAPTAKIDDGLLDVVIMKKVPFYASSQVVFHLFNDSLHHSKYVEIIKCRKLEISQPNLKAHIDGEPIFFPEGIKVEIIPSSLNILVPSSDANKEKLHA